jgi:hypothetical protein
MMARALEDVHEANDIGIHVRMRVLDGIPHPGLGGQIHDGVERLEQALHRFTVCDVRLDEPESSVRGQLRQASTLQGNVVVRVEVVDANDGIAALEETLAEMKPDETRCTGHEDFHDAIL